MPLSLLEESIAREPEPDSDHKDCCFYVFCCCCCCRSCTWVYARVQSWRWDACRACGSFDMNPPTAGDLCTVVEAANLKDGFQTSAGTNYMVYRKSVLKLAVMLMMLRAVLGVFVIKSDTDNAQDMHGGGTIVIDPQVQADCLPLCALTASEVARGVNESFAEAAATSPNASSIDPWDLQQVEATALTTCLSLCVGSRTSTLPMQIAAGSTCRLDLNESMASGNTVVVCDPREAPPPSALGYRLAIIDITRKTVGTIVSIAWILLLWAAVVSWRHFRSSMKYICFAVFATLAQPYLMSLVPWYELFRLGDFVSDSMLYALSPELADLDIRSRVTLPVFFALQSGLLALFPALSYAAVTAKTFDPGNSFMDALVAGVPVFLLTFNWPLWALVWQVTGSVMFLVGGLLFSGSRLIFTCYFKRIAFSDDNTKTITLLSRLSTMYLAGVCLGCSLIAAGVFLEFREVGEKVLGDLLGQSPLQLVDFAANYYVQFYVSYIAATDILVFGAVHFGSKRLSLIQLEEEASGLAASYAALTCEEAVFRGGRRWTLCPFPV